MYVIFEGIDTSGKSTQLDILCKKNPNIVATKEPGQTPLGKNLRDIILHTHDISKKAEFFLFLADRAEHFKKLIEPNIDKLIISDRGFISGMAYAYCNDKSIDFDFLLHVNRYALCDTMPNKVVLFETNEKLLCSRLKKKEHDSIEKRGISYLLDVQSAMGEICKRLELECLHVNANDTIDDITKQIEGFLR